MFAVSARTPSFHHVGTNGNVLVIDVTKSNSAEADEDLERLDLLRNALIARIDGACDPGTGGIGNVRRRTMHANARRPFVILTGLN